jgi:hypothetical protein
MIQVKTGAELIAQERQEQLSKHHRTVWDDWRYNDNNQMAYAARSLVIPNDDRLTDSRHYRPDGWDWDLWDKMYNKPYKERLIIAGALIAAEIDRLDFEPT